MSLPHLLLLLILAVLGVACAAPAVDGDGPSTEASVVTAGNELTNHVSGYDFDGPKSLASAIELGDACKTDSGLLRDVERVCLETGGEPREAEDCKVLCSIPVAKAGNVAGYDFSGFKITTGGSEKCSEIGTAELVACTNVGGKIVSASGCRSLCSSPIARPGKVAGYSHGRFRIGAATTASTCSQADVFTDEQIACASVGGKPHGLAGCSSLLCSLPF